MIGLLSICNHVQFDQCRSLQFPFYRAEISKQARFVKSGSSQGLADLGSSVVEDACTYYKPGSHPSSRGKGAVHMLLII